jgi:hypothetical protein
VDQVEVDIVEPNLPSDWSKALKAGSCARASFQSLVVTKASYRATPERLRPWPTWASFRV